MECEERSMGCTFRRPITRRFLQKLIRPRKKITFVVCEKGNRIVGFGYAETQKQTILLHNFFVMPEFRTLGIATNIFHKIVRHLRGRTSNISAYILKNNRYALEFWRKQDFKIDQTLSNAFKVSRLV